MKKNLGTSVFIGCLALAVPCEAKILLSSISGVINVPSAHVGTMGTFSLMAQQTEDGPVFGVNAAVLPSLEVAYSRFSPKHEDDFNMVSAKYQLLSESVLTPAVAVGIEDIGDKLERAGYVVATKEGPWGFRGHVGIGTGRFQNGFVAMEKQFKVNSDVLNLSLALEYDGHNFNYGVALPVGKLVQAEIGMRSNDLYAGINCTF
jgi:hypothetical protein